MEICKNYITSVCRKEVDEKLLGNYHFNNNMYYICNIFILGPGYAQLEFMG